jgi:hypothetical protein
MLFYSLCVPQIQCELEIHIQDLKQKKNSWNFINDVIFFLTRLGIQKMSINLVNHAAFQRPAVLWMDNMATHHPIIKLDLNISGLVH